MSKNKHADDHSIARFAYALAVVAMATSVACAHGPGTNTTSDPPATEQPEQGYPPPAGEAETESEMGGEAPPPPPGDPPAPPPGAGAPGEPGTTIEDDALKQFARAYADAITIQNDFQAKAAQAQNEEEVRQLGAQMNEAIQGSIVSNGMTVERFNEIASRLDQDEELRNRLQKELETETAP